MKLFSTIVLTVVAVFPPVLGESSTFKPITIKLEKKTGSLLQTKSVTKHFLTNRLALNDANKGARHTPNVYQKYVGDNLFLGKINVGNPPQTMSVQFDTGSSFTWVMSSTVCRKNQTFCEERGTYDHSKSKTYHKYGKKFNMTYVTGFASGITVKDDLSVEKLTIRGQLFGEATDFDDGFDVPDYSGIFGLGFAPDDVPDVPTVEPPLRSMIDQNLLREPAFGIYIPRNKDYAELTLGDVDDQRFTGNFVYSPVVFKSAWGIKLEKILVCNSEIGGPYYSIIDTGASVLAGPNATVKAINKALGAKYNKYDEATSAYSYFIECNKQNLPTLTFIINNHPLKISGKDLVDLQTRDPDNDLFCLTNIVSFDFLEIFFLGVPFIQNYYIKYDVGQLRIGFAPSV